MVRRFSAVFAVRMLAEQRRRCTHPPACCAGRQGGHRHRALGSTLALEVAEKEPEGVVPGLLEGQLSGDPSDDVERAASQLEPVKVPCYLKRLLFGHIL